MRVAVNHASHGCAGGRELLAREGECAVERCVCGTVYLTLGALTIRLHEGAFTSLAALLDQASKNLARVAPERSDNSGTLVS
jgi:hypothetical protein